MILNHTLLTRRCGVYLTVLSRAPHVQCPCWHFLCISVSIRRQNVARAMFTRNHEYLCRVEHTPPVFRRGGHYSLLVHMHKQLVLITIMYVCVHAVLRNDIGAGRNGSPHNIVSRCCKGLYQG